VHGNGEVRAPPPPTTTTSDVGERTTAPTTTTSVGERGAQGNDASAGGRRAGGRGAGAAAGGPSATPAAAAAAVTPAPPDVGPPPAAAAVLDAKDDAYGGVIVDEARLPSDPREFSARLAASLAAWRARGVRGVWIKLPPALSSLVAPAIREHDFDYHHAEPSHVMLTRWLPLEDGVESGLPPNASHQVGVGALVVDARRGLVLAVQERTGPLRGKGVWKLPTGLVHAGEDLHAAAVREVEEETGVRARFAGVLAVRQAHGFAFGKSDLFFLCALVAEDGGGGGGGLAGLGGAGAGGSDGGDASALGSGAKQGRAEKGKGRAGGAEKEEEEAPALAAPALSPSPPSSLPLGPPQPVVACEREIERVAWLSVDEYEREQGRFNGHLPLYSEMLGRSMGWARAAVEAAARAGGGRGGGGGGGASAASAAAAAVGAAVETARRMGMRGEVLDSGIFKPRSDLLLWVDGSAQGGGKAEGEK